MQVAVGYRQRNDGFGLSPNNELRDLESHTAAVPIGLTQHLLTKGDEMLIGKLEIASQIEGMAGKSFSLLEDGTLAMTYMEIVFYCANAEEVE